MAHMQTSEPGSYVPDENEDFQKAVDDFILLLKTHGLENILEEDIDLNKQINAKEIKSDVTSKPFERNGSRNLLNQQMISSGSDVHKELKPEMCGISDQVISTSSDTVCITSDSQTYASSISEQVASYQSHSTVVSPEYLNIEKPYPQKQSMQKNEFLDEKNNLNFTENTTLNMIVSEKENSECKIADSEDFETKGLFSLYRAEAACEDINQSKSCIEKIKNGSLLKVQTLETKHYQSQNMNFRTSYYTTKFYCAVCKVIYKDKGSHEGYQTCDVCKRTFECKVQLEDHYLIHEELHETICRICHFEIDKHEAIKEKSQYLCCQCGLAHRGRSDLKRHLYSHSPLKLFKCEFCELRFKQFKYAKTHFKRMHPLCEICEKHFFNQNFLDKHRFEQHGYAYVHRLHENAP